ncbi:vanadium-dependent haloperoxidase [Larkinella soli]|uniref:vanadium-dependent haloperoxidase n=1 Tax=Larkinella soli TaxID=1770527 RepID=UPI0013E37AC6|nr:vanadium-dependent haloperoxidase [Larkinella soli]
MKKIRMRFGIGLMLTGLLAASCQDHPIDSPTPADPSAYPAEVVTSWLNLQLRLTQTTPASPLVAARRFAYSGIAVYESLVPGLPAYQSIAPKLNGLPALPKPDQKESYYWPACANAAFAAMSRAFFTTTSAANKASMDSLETALLNEYRKVRTNEELARSETFGKQIAAAVLDWAKTDGNDNTTPYTPPTGDGLWVPTPPANAAAAFPNWGKNRPLVKGSDAGADPGAPTPFSKDPASPYYAQVKEVYDLSKKLTDEQKTIALFWADSPDGKSLGGGHWHAILHQILLKERSNLGQAATAYARLGLAMSDACISLFKSKYTYNAVRPITYIRTVMNQADWNTLFPTPNHPEYPSGHTVLSAAAAHALGQSFGENYRFRDNSYQYLGFAPRDFDSFEKAVVEVGLSRVYAGLHYRKTCEVSLHQGKTVSQNIANQLRFRK